MSASTSPWRPDASNLIWREGRWVAPHASAISYPEAANNAFLAIEDESYWFRHRLDCLLELVRALPPQGDLYDIGGGNGFVARGLEQAGWPSVLIEPGAGARNAVSRGVSRVIQATLQDAQLAPRSLPAAGAFDVIEHIEDDRAFLGSLRDSLRPGARFYCTVPAWPSLWSSEDEAAGHFRRYTPHSLARVLRAAGFEVEFLSPIFSWLVTPLFLLRALPSRLSRRPTRPHQWDERTTADHRLPSPLRPIVHRLHAAELAALRARRSLRTGTSLLCVARNASP